MTPFEIEILMHYYTTTTPHRVEIENPPIWKETRQWFLDNDLLRVRSQPSDYGATYETTERAAFWIEYVCNLPLPTQHWGMRKEQA